MENEKTIHKILDLVEACGYNLDDWKREAISQAVDTWLSQNPIHFVRDRDNGITTLTFEEFTTHKKYKRDDDGLMGSFSAILRMVQRQRGLSSDSDDYEEYRKIKTHRFSIDGHGFSYSQDEKQDPPQKPRVKDRFSAIADRLGIEHSAVKDSISAHKAYQAMLGTTDSIEDFTGKRACESRVAQLKQHIFEILGIKPEDEFSRFILMTTNDGHLLRSGKDVEKEEKFDPATALSDGLTRMEQGRRKAAARKFITSLDLDVVRIMRDTKMDTIEALDWLYAGGDETKQRYRRQAAQSYPLLTPLMAQDRLKLDVRSLTKKMAIDTISVNMAVENNPYKDGLEQIEKQIKTIEDLQNTIDEGQPLAAFLQTNYVGEFRPLSKRVLKSIGRIKEVPDALAGSTEYYVYLPFLEHVDSNWHPKTPEELIDFIDCAKRIGKLHIKTGQPIADILQTTRGQWAWWKERTISDEAVRDIDDYLGAVYNTVLAPRIYQRVDELGIQAPKSEMQQRWMQAVIDAGKNGLIRDFASSYSALDILDCSQKWHEFGDTYRTRMAALKAESGIDKDAIDKKWLPLSQDYTASNGIVLKAMTTQEELEATGAYNDEGLHFCVGTYGYWAKCMTESDHIVVLFDTEGKRLSAVQLKEVRDEKGEVSGLHNAQHQAGKDPQTEMRRQVSDAEHAARDEYVKAILTDPEWTPDFEAIEAARVDNRKEFWKSGLSDVLGFDPSKPEARAKAVSIMQEFLPKALRTLDHGSVIVANDMAGKVDQRIHDIHARAKEGKIAVFGGINDIDLGVMQRALVMGVIRPNANDDEQIGGRMARAMREVRYGGHAQREDLHRIIDLPDNNPE